MLCPERLSGHRGCAARSDARGEPGVEDAPVPCRSRSATVCYLHCEDT